MSGIISAISAGDSVYDVSFAQDAPCSGQFQGTATLVGGALAFELAGTDCLHEPGSRLSGFLSRNMLDGFQPWAVSNKVLHADGYQEGDFWTTLLNL